MQVVDEKGEQCMEHEQVEKEVARKSAMIYLPISIGAALLFLLAASLAGSYPTVAKVGGTVWVGLLSLIVSMPIVTSNVKRQFKGQ
jgi:hypothetical protein